MKAKNIETINRSFERQAENFESRKLAFSKQEYLDYTLRTVAPRKTGFYPYLTNNEICFDQRWVITIGTK